jgi:hypothetical protein
MGEHDCGNDSVVENESPLIDYTEVGICCFLLKYGVCDPPRPPCRFHHPTAFVNDDGITPCCFGPTCRFGHAKRVRDRTGRTLQEKRDYWHQYNPTTHTPDNYSPAVRNATLLQSQLEPWSTAVLRERLARVFHEDHTALDGLGRTDIMNLLLRHYETHVPRHILHVRGVPLRSDLCTGPTGRIESLATTAWCGEYTTLHTGTVLHDSPFPSRIQCQGK